jgi:hypothetical protein
MSGGMKTVTLFSLVSLLSPALQPAFADGISDARAKLNSFLDTHPGRDKWSPSDEDEYADLRIELRKAHRQSELKERSSDGDLLPEKQLDSCDGLPEAEKEKCLEKKLDAFREVIHAATPLGLGAMGLYEKLPNLSKLDYRLYSKLMQAAGLPFAPPSIASQEAQCLKALGRFEYGKRAGDLARHPTQGKVHEVLTVRKTINGKSELFVWDGMKLWRMESDVESSHANASTFLHGKKTPVWSLARQEKTGDGRFTKAFPESAINEITAELIETGFTSAMKKPSELKVNIAPACRNVGRVSVIDRGSRVSVADFSNRVLNPLGPNAIVEFSLGQSEAPQIANPNQDSADCPNCVGDSRREERSSNVVNKALEAQ